MIDDQRIAEQELIMSTINELVEKYGMTPQSIAEAIGCVTQNVRGWRRGKTCPRPHLRMMLFLLLESMQKNG